MATKPNPFGKKAAPFEMSKKDKEPKGMKEGSKKEEAFDKKQAKAPMGNPFAKGKPVIGVAFHQQAIAAEQTGMIDDLIARIEAAGAVPLAFYSPVMDNDANTKVLASEGKPLAGAPIKQRWTLRHDPEFPCPAEQRVTWTYRRSWEPFNHSDQQASVLLQGLESAK